MHLHLQVKHALECPASTSLEDKQALARLPFVHGGSVSFFHKVRSPVHICLSQAAFASGALSIAEVLQADGVSKPLVAWSANMIAYALAQCSCCCSPYLCKLT